MSSGSGFIHMIAHWLGWNGGRVVTKYADDGKLWVAFECNGCGEISGRYQLTYGAAYSLRKD